MSNRHGTRREIKAFKRAEAEARNASGREANYNNGVLYKAPVGASTIDVSQWEEIGYVDQVNHPVQLDAGLDLTRVFGQGEMLDDEIHHGTE